MERQATAPGTYPVTEVMPCPPDEVRVGRYLAPNTLGKGEAEEAAARLVIFCQEAGLWCGMGATNLAAMINEDIQLILRATEVRERNADRLEQYDRELQRYRSLSILTLGIYALFNQKPQCRQEEIPHLPFSMLQLNPDLLFYGFHWLDKEGYAVHSREGGEEGEDVFYPTAKLIHALRGNRQVE